MRLCELGVLKVVQLLQRNDFKQSFKSDCLVCGSSAIPDSYDEAHIAIRED